MTYFEHSWISDKVAVDFFQAAHRYLEDAQLDPELIQRGWQADWQSFDSAVDALIHNYNLGFRQLRASHAGAGHTLGRVLRHHDPQIVDAIYELEARKRWLDAGLRRKPRADVWLAFRAILDAGEIEAAYRFARG